MVLYLLEHCLEGVEYEGCVIILGMLEDVKLVIGLGTLFRSLVKEVSALLKLDIISLYK